MIVIPSCVYLPFRELDKIKFSRDRNNEYLRSYRVCHAQIPMRDRYAPWSG